MIYRLRGNIVEVQAGFIVVETGGVGYGVFVPERLTETRLKTGDETTVLTHTSVTQDDIRLFGFLSGLDREFFRMLIKIPRIGPKGALKILSNSPAAVLMQVILSGDTKKLSKFQGVGAKTAGRLIVELQEKVKKLMEQEEVEFDDVFEEVVEVLTGLGCSPDEAREAVSKVRSADEGVEKGFDQLFNESIAIISENEMKV